MSDGTDRSGSESTPNREEELLSFGAEKDADVEGHRFGLGAEDKVGSAEGIRPDDGPEGEVEGHVLRQGAEGIRPIGEYESEEPEVEGHRFATNAEKAAFEAERFRN